MVESNLPLEPSPEVLASMSPADLEVLPKLLEKFRTSSQQQRLDTFILLVMDCQTTRLVAGTSLTREKALLGLLIQATSRLKGTEHSQLHRSASGELNMALENVDMTLAMLHLSGDSIRHAVGLK